MPISVRLVILLAVLGLGLSGLEMWRLRGFETDSAPPAELRIGLTPDQTPEQLRKRYGPLVDHLSRATGLPCRLVIPADYSELRDRFVAGEIDLAWFGGFTFVQTNQLCGANPIVMRDTDLRFTSAYLVRKGYVGRTLADFEGKRLAFGDRLSTSGHLMPRYFMSAAGIVPEQFFGGIEYTGAHDRTAERVRDKAVDIGVANAAIVRSMFDSGRLSTDEVSVLAETPPYPDYVWAVRRSLHSATTEALRNAFLELTPMSPTHAAILEAQHCGAFLPAGVQEFDRLARAARNTGVLGQ